MRSRGWGPIARLMSFKGREDRSELSLCLSYEDTAEGGSLQSQRKDPHYELNLLAP